MKEHAFLYAKRPFALCSATEAKLELSGTLSLCLLDELVAIKLGFPIHQLQYSRLSLNGKAVRVCGVTRVTIQAIKNGRSGKSIAFSAKIVRDLTLHAGAEALADQKTMMKINAKENKASEEIKIEESSESEMSETEISESEDDLNGGSLNQIMAIMDRNDDRRRHRNLKRKKENELENEDETKNQFKMNAARPLLSDESKEPHLQSYKSSNPDVKKTSFVIGGIEYENQEDFQLRNPSIPISPPGWPPNLRRLSTRSSSWHPTEKPGSVPRWGGLGREHHF